jgi:hypothetical protein
MGTPFNIAIRVALLTSLVTVVCPRTGAAQDVPKLGALSSSSIALLANDSAEASTIDVWQATPPAQRDSRLNGFLIGFAAGAIPGVILGMGIMRYCDNEARNCPIAVPVAGALFGFAGGGIGYAIDGAIGESRTLARPRPSLRVRFRF